eukprot:369615_1
MTDTELLLVSGYIRTVEFHLTNDDCLHMNVVPDCVIKLCLLFYSMANLVFISHFSEYPGYGVQSYDIVNLQTKHVLKMIIQTYTPFTHYISSKLPVYIPNVSNILCNLSTECMQNLKVNFIHQIYDGLFGITISSSGAYSSTTDYFPCLMLFEAKRDIYFKILVSENKLIRASKARFDIVYCGATRGIIYVVNDKLYQMSIENIKDYDFQLKQLTFSNAIPFTASYCRLKMQYLENTDMLFAMDLCNSKDIDCAMFDFKSNKWNNEIASYPNKFHDFQSTNPKLRCSMCYDGNNIIYIATNSGCFASYNIQSNLWTHIGVSTDEKLHKATLWIDEGSNILNYAVIDNNNRIKVKYVEQNTPLGVQYKQTSSIHFDYNKSKRISTSIFH